jgi:uncharacterized Zn-binding protein involved in type VI secretion
VTTRQQSEPITTVAALLDTLEQRPDLAIDADLTITVNGNPMTVTGYGDTVAVDVPSLSGLVSLWRGLPAGEMDLAAGLSSIGLTTEVRVRGVPLARLGDSAVPSWIADRIGIGPVELLPEGIALAALTRSHG